MAVGELARSQADAGVDPAPGELDSRAEANFAAMQQHAAADLEPEREQLLDRAYKEYCALIKKGIDVDAARYIQGYPKHQSSLRQLIGAKHLAEEIIRQLAKDNKKPAWPKPGDLYLGFKIERVLGHGGASRVFLATEPALGNRAVVVKVSPRGAAEAKTMGRLSHPNIVQVHSVQKDAASRWTAVCMPYLGSATLHHVLDRVLDAMPARAQVIVEAAQCGVRPNPAASPPEPWPLPPSATYVEGVCHVGAQVAEALQFLHERGIYHHDLKPSNVLLTAEGRPMLLDFNSCTTALPGPAFMSGTPPYMSPEQLRSWQNRDGAPRKAVDGCSDLYALGVMLYELLAGRHPFGPVPDKFKLEDFLPTLLERQQRRPTRLEELNPAVPPRLARLVERCLAFNPAQRPQRAAEVAAALRPKPSPWQQARLFAGHHTWLSTVVAVFLMLIGGATAMALWQQQAMDPAELVRLGRQAYRDGQFSKAVEHFSEVLKVDAGRHDVLLARARAYLRWGESEEQYYSSAFNDFQLAEKRQSSGEISAGAGYCLLRFARPKEAKLRFEEALAGNFSTPAVHNNLAFCLITSKDFDEAQKHLDLALANPPFMQAALHNRGKLRMAQISREGGGYGDPAQLARAKVKSPQLYARCWDWLTQGKEDLNKAIVGAKPVPVELNLDAARLWAIGTSYAPNDKVFAMDCLEKALRQGYDPKFAKSDPCFINLRSETRFQTMFAVQHPIQPLPQSPCIVNPLAD